MEFPSLNTKKKEIPSSLIGIDVDQGVETVIICNVIDQFSLLGAYAFLCFFKDALGRRSVKIVDVRDPVILSDDYYFVGIGSYEDYRRHVTNSVFFTTREVEILERMDEVVGISRNPKITTHPRIFDARNPDPRICSGNEEEKPSVLLLALTFMEKYGSNYLPDLFKESPLYRSSYFADIFDNSVMDQAGNQKHYSDVNRAFIAYLYAGTTDTEKYLQELPSAYDSNTRNFNARMSDRLQLITISGIYHYHMNAVNPDVFGSIRRFNTAKRPFVHITHGAYGTVICYRSSAVANSELGKNYPNALMMAI